MYTLCYTYVGISLYRDQSGAKKFSLSQLLALAQMILILNNAVIFIGVFLLALASKDATAPTVCHVFETVNSEELSVTWFLCHDEFFKMQNLPQPPPIPLDLFSNVLLCWVMEVFEMRSSRTSINKSSIIDVAFVFHMKLLETQLPNCAGMSRVFCIRYCYDEYNWLTEVRSNQHLPFSTIVMDSYPSQSGTLFWRSKI